MNSTGHSRFEIRDLPLESHPKSGLTTQRLQDYTTDMKPMSLPALCASLLLPCLAFAQTQSEALAPVTSPTPIQDPKILKQAPYDSIENDIAALIGAKRQMDLAPLGLVMYEVQDTLHRFNDSVKDGGADLPQIMSAEFDFKVSTATVVGVKVNLWILTLGGSLEKDHVNDVTFTYARPAPPKQTLSPLSFGPASDFFKKIADLFTKKKQEPPPARLSDELLATIQAAAIAAKNEFKIDNVVFDKKVTVQIQFGVKLDAQASASIPVYALVVGPSIDRNANVTQSVKLVFGKAGG